MPSPSSSRPQRPRPSSPRPSTSRPRNPRSSVSHSSGALLDPYGIYGARTATRLRDSHRRRQSQSIFLILFLIVLGIIAVVALKTRRVKTESPSARQELAMPVFVPPIWIESSSGAPGVLLIAGEDGRLLKTTVPGGTGETDSETKKMVLLETDFPLHTPLIFGEIAFVPCEDGVLYAVSWRERKLLWRRRFDAALTSQPTLLTINKKPVLIAGSDSGLLYALDAATGTTLWQMRLPAPIGNSLTAIQTSPNVPGAARILVPLLGGAAMRGGLWCLDGATGKTLWRFPSDGRVEATQLAAPTVDFTNGKIYFGNDVGAVFCLDLQTGQYKVNPTSQPQRGWKTFIAPMKNHDASQATLLRAAPILSDGNQSSSDSSRDLIIGGNDGGVRCLNASDGKLRWQSDVGAPVSSLTMLKSADNRESVLVCNRSSQLVLLDAANGSVIKHFSSGSDQFVGVTVSSQSVIAATSNGGVLQFPLSK